MTETRALVVSPRSALDDAIARHRPSRVVSLRSPGADPVGFPGLDEGEVLHLAFNDIAEDRPGLVSPSAANVTALLDFAAGWETGTMLVHCYAGISRSTAAALVMIAALMPEREEGELVRALRKLSPEATPNPYLIRLADGMLGRNGRLIRAVAGIGRGVEAFEGKPFVLPLTTNPTG